MRDNSIDAVEPFERSVIGSYYAGMAVQTFNRVQNQISRFGVKYSDLETFDDKLEFINQADKLIIDPSVSSQEQNIVRAYLGLMQGVVSDIEKHNQSMEDGMSGEMNGYFDKNGFWIEPEEFGGSDNRTRFEGIAEETGVSLGDYTKGLEIDVVNQIFRSVSPKLANQMSGLTNLYIKPSSESGGDTVNAAAILSTTKIGNQIEETNLNQYDSVFDSGGKKRREGYYYTQGASEQMVIHAVQKRMLDFVSVMESVVG